jgi:PPP family 3-phenylpropionic acid transporter
MRAVAQQRGQVGQGGRSISVLFCAHFALVGALSPYFGLYLEAWGLSIAQIGMLLAVPQLLRLFAPSLWGAWADRPGARGRMLRVSALGLVIAMAMMLAARGHYATLLVCLAILHFFMAGQSPIAESIALGLARGDAGAYGRMRQWGSIGFIAAVTATGPLLDLLGARWLGLPIVFLAVGLLAASWRAAAMADDARPATARASPAPVWPRLREPWIALFFTSCALMMFAHAALYGFHALLLDRQGYSKTAIGLVWAIGVLAEIALFRWQHRLFARHDAMRLLCASMLVAALRFAIIGSTDGHWSWVLASQLMHAITFGVHHSAAMALLHRAFDPGSQGRAQGLYATLGYGVGGAAGTLVAGWVWTSASPQAAFLVAAAAALLGALAVAVCLRLDYPRPS